MMEKDIYTSIGNQIKKYRKRAGLTQQTLADIMDWTTSFVSRLENGQSMTSIQGLIDLSQALDVPIDALLVEIPVPSDISDDPSLSPQIMRITTKLHSLNAKQLEYVSNNIDLLLAMNIE